MGDRPNFFFFFFNDTATTEIYTLSLHDALPISSRRRGAPAAPRGARRAACGALTPRGCDRCRTSCATQLHGKALRMVEIGPARRVLQRPVGEPPAVVLDDGREREAQRRRLGEPPEPAEMP